MLFLRTAFIKVASLNLPDTLRFDKVPERTIHEAREQFMESVRCGIPAVDMSTSLKMSKNSDEEKTRRNEMQKQLMK